MSEETNIVMGETIVHDAFHKHAVVHTSNVIANLFDREIVQHVWVESDPELLQMAEEIDEKLRAFYQLSAEKAVG